jgi:cell division protein FtsB
MNTRQVIFTVYTVFFAGLAMAAGVLLYNAREEYRELKKTEAKLQATLVEKQAQLKEQQRILERLKTDRDYVERVIRRRLNYVKPGETVFRFPED